MTADPAAPDLRFCEIARFVDNVEETAAFYERLLGRAPVARSPDMAVFASDDVTVLIHRAMPAGPDDPPCEDHIAFATSDLDASVAALRELGVMPAHPPRSYSWGRSAYLRDPAGRLVELIERKDERPLRQPACRQ